MVSMDQMEAINVALRSSQEQVATLSRAVDSVRAEASGAVQELRAALATEQQRVQQLMQNGGDRPERQRSLVNTKTFEGGVFIGAKTENFRAWAKKVKIYCNAQSKGFKKAMELAEKQDSSVDASDIQNFGWNEAVDADSKLHDFLSTYTSIDAQRIVDEVPDRGFEAWRKLKLRYHPEGGAFELERTTRMLTAKQCKSLSELPAQIDILEKGFRQYEITFGVPFPDPLKIPMLLKVLPETHKKELTLKFTLGERNYQKMAAAIMGFSNDERIRDQQQHGQRDMDVDNLEKEKNKEYTDQEWDDHRANLEQELEDLDYMGKGKGKGGGWQRKGKSKGSKGRGKEQPARPSPSPGQETRTCNWCQKVGHLKSDCRSFLAGRPKAPKPANAGSLDAEGDWQEDDLGSITAEEPLESLEESGVEELMPVGDDDDESDDSDDGDWTDEPVETPTRQSFLSQFSPASMATPTRALGQLPSLPGFTSTMTVSEVIAKQQEDLRLQVEHILTPSKASRESPLKPEPEPVEPPPGMHEAGAGTRRVKKKNRNQSAKQKIIQVLETRECGEDCGCTGMEIGVNTEREFMDETNIMIKPKMVDMGTDAAKDEQKPEVCTVEVQTNTSLSHTLRDMMWTPSGLDPIVEIDYSEDDIIEPGFL